jgi:hypothetical protein
VWLRTGAADQNVFVQWQCAAKDTDSPVLFQPAAATLLPLTDAAGRINTQPVSQVGDLQWPTKARRGKDPTAAEQSIVATTGYTLQCPPQFALIEWTVTTPMWTALQLKAFDD